MTPSNMQLRGMSTDMETEVPDRTSSSSQLKNKPQRKGSSKGRRSPTPKKQKQQLKQKRQQSQKRVKGYNKQLSLNSSWSSKNSKRSYKSRSSAGTVYTNLSYSRKNNNQQPKMCRFWRQKKCTKEHCEFAHYQLKHLNTTYNECMKEGAKAINDVYNNSILKNMALVQVTSLQYMTYEEIERRMQSTLNYKEEIQIAITNKKAFQRFKKEYYQSSKLLDDDSYNNKIQLKINVLRKYYEQINNQNLPKQKISTYDQVTDSQINQNPQKETSPTLIQISNGKNMGNEQQQQNQQDKSLINNYTILEIDQRQTKKKDKNKKEDIIIPSSRQNVMMETNQKKSVERKKSIQKRNETPKPILKKQSNTPQQSIYNQIELKHSKKQTSFSPVIMEKANRLTGIITQYRISDLNKVAIQTKQNQGQLPETAQQRLFPPLMKAKVLYPNYIISQITNNQNEINEIGLRLSINNEMKEKIKAKITIDAAPLYLFKVSMLYTNNEEQLDKVLNNVAILATQKIKNVMRECLNIDIEEANKLGIRHVLELPSSSKDQINYYQDYLFNIGSEEKQVMVVVQVQDVPSQSNTTKI